MKFALDPLPYDYAALEPHISAQTLHFHYDKHHSTYLDKLASAIKGSPMADKSLEQIIADSEGSVFNSAAQVWNHTFYWNSMHPQGGGEPQGELAQRLQESFGSVEAFRQAFAEAAQGEFGSGWAWLVVDPDASLRVISSTDAENPVASRLTPLLTIDVWEHAYYLDYQNERAKYIKAWLDNLVNWEFAAGNLKLASQQSAASA